MEKAAKTQGAAIKPVPMKLFATWEVDRTPSNCIPRLCSLTLSRLVVPGGLGSDVNSLTIAVKVQGSKRTLRSNEIALQPDGKLDTELQLNFSLQYPHFLKREGNTLHVMLQRRKRYKNRTILGYKTLAEGRLNMSQVLQREMEMELELTSGDKDGKGVLGKVWVTCVDSQPVDNDGKRRGGDGELSEEEEDYSSGEELSDSEQELRPPHPPVHQNFKQKFIALLKKFKISEESLMPERKLSGGVDEIANLFHELEELEEDSGGEMDTVSVSSTPKPSLRPFFASTRSLGGDPSGQTLGSDCVLPTEDPVPSSSPPKPSDHADRTTLTAKKKILRDKASNQQLQDHLD